MLNNYYNRVDIAELCEISIRQVYRLSQEKKMPAPDFKVGNTHFWKKSNQKIIHLIKMYNRKYNK